MFLPPAAYQALKSFAAAAFALPFTGMLPPNHVKGDWFGSTMSAGE